MPLAQQIPIPIWQFPIQLTLMQHFHGISNQHCSNTMVTLPDSALLSASSNVNDFAVLTVKMITSDQGRYIPQENLFLN